MEGRGELQGQDGAELLQACQKYINFCYSHEARPIKNCHLRVPSLYSRQACGLPFHKRCCSLNAASFSQLSSFEATPTLDSLEVFRGDINPRSGLEGLRPGPLSSSRAGVVTTPALGFCLGLARQAKLLRKREAERPSLSCNSRLESIYKLPVGWGED